MEGHATRSILPLILAVLAFVTGLFAVRPSGISASQLPSSGIALYDSLASQVDNVLQSSSYDLLVPDDYVLASGMDIPAGMAELDQAAIAELEGQFGSDPRFWQLCWLMRAHGGKEQYLAQDRYYCPLLKDAWQRGIRDEGMCYLLYMQSEGKERTTFIESGRVHWADNSFWHYAAAEQCLQDGDLAGFRKALNAGNATVRNERPVPWPLAELDSDSQLPGDADSLAVQGVLAQISRSQRNGALRSPVDPYSLIAPKKMDLPTVNAYIDMQVRLAAMQGNGLVQLWRPLVAISSLLAEPELGSEWNVAESNELEALRQQARLLEPGELPAVFGMQLEDNGTLEFASSPGAAAMYDRNQQSWINTLNSWKLDQQRAAQKAQQVQSLFYGR